MSKINIEQADKYQEFFNFMKQEHNLLLTIDEMDEILKEAEKLRENLCTKCEHCNSKDFELYTATKFICNNCGKLFG